MSYKKFNKYIYKYFFKKENIGETIIMAVDEKIMSGFYIKHQISEIEFKEQIRHKFCYTWNSAFEKEKGIPQIFGLIAIQIYVAFLMQKEEGNYTEREYNPRLEDYLGIYSLQQLYESYQDNLWKRLKKWTKKNNYIVAIPKPKMYAGRYTQYPLSQALLNQEDLKKVPFLFQNAGLKPDEYMPFEDFVLLIEHSDRSIHLPNHYYRVKEKLLEQNKKQLLHLQLFGFFNNEWDGSYPIEKKKEKRKINQIEKNRTFLTIHDNFEKINILNQEYQCLNECSLKHNQLFKIIKKYYNLFHQDILLFIKDKSYDEWIDCRYFEPNSEYIIICKIYSQAEAFIRKLDKDYERYKNAHYSIFKVSLSNKISNHFYWKPFYSKKQKNYTFENGLKLSRKTWMFGAGPTIKFSKKTDAWINGEKLTFNTDELYFSCRDFEDGTYRLKVKNLSPDKFHITKPKVVHDISLLGWKINIKDSMWEIDNQNFQFSGLSTWFPKQAEIENIRTWINGLTKQTAKSKIRNSSIVINAIKRAKYGI